MCNLYTMTATVAVPRWLDSERDEACVLAQPFSGDDTRMIEATG